MTKTNRTLSPFWAFLSLTYGISWVCWIPAAILGQDVMRFPTLLLHTLGGFGPSLAGVIMVHRMYDRAGRRDFWRRVVDIRQIGVGRTVFILIFFPLVALTSILLSQLVGGPVHAYTRLAILVSQPLSLLMLLPIGLIAGPIPEELGWRGFAQDRLDARMGPWASSVLMGLSWGLWHLPLFWISGTPQAAMGIHSLEFWLYLLNPIPLSALFAWMYRQTGRSILSAILMHLGFNVTTNLLYPLSPQASVVHASLLLTCMAILLRRRPEGMQDG